MNTDCQPPAEVPKAVSPVSAPSSTRCVDSIDEPARPLTAKRAALQQRRQRDPHVRTGARAAGTLAATFESSDGTVAFALRGSPQGLLVERTQRHPAGARLMQCLVFVDPATFDRWCDSDPIRFEDPVAHAHLRRAGHEALGHIR